MFQNQNRVYYWYMALVEPRDLPTFVWKYLHLANLWNNEAVYAPLPTLQSPQSPNVCHNMAMFNCIFPALCHLC